MLELELELIELGEVVSFDIIDELVLLSAGVDSLADPDAFVILVPFDAIDDEETEAAISIFLA